MKKKLISCLVLLMAAIAVIVFTVQSSRIVGYDGLIAKARKEIGNLADVESIEMVVAGKSTIDQNHHLFWIITGNEYQMHRYYPLEVTELDNGEYKFVRMHNGGTQRGQDIFFEYFGMGYSFVINNPKCKRIVIDELVVPVTEIPFVYYYPFSPHEYRFLDEEGNVLS